MQLFYFTDNDIFYFTDNDIIFILKHVVSVMFSLLHSSCMGGLQTLASFFLINYYFTEHLVYNILLKIRSFVLT